MFEDEELQKNVRKVPPVLLYLLSNEFADVNNIWH